MAVHNSNLEWTVIVIIAPLSAAQAAPTASMDRQFWRQFRFNQPTLYREGRHSQDYQNYEEP